MIFKNTTPCEPQGFLDILKWKFQVDPEISVIPDAPDVGAEVIPFSPGEDETKPDSGWTVAWLGHASFLIRSPERTILIDPIFSEYCAPVRLSGMKRASAPACRLEDLPKIDAVLLTHSHYDHLDLPTLRALGKDVQYCIAEGHASWLKKKLGIDAVRELAWGDSLELFPGIRLTSTPAQHFTGRTPFDRDHAHWCGWLLEGEGCKIWHAGDSGYCDAFEEIGRKYGPIDFGMIPIGAYQPRKIMREMHMNPEEAVQAFLDARCKRAVGMHWGTFRLTDEPLGEPPLRLAREAQRLGLEEDSFFAAPVGSVWKVVEANVG